MTKLQLRPFEKITPQMMDFVKHCPWKPLWSSELVTRFLTNFISHRDLVFDVWDGDERRVALAVLLDRISNSGNLACLEVLAVDSTYDVIALYTQILQRSRQCLPQDKSGFQVSMAITPPIAEEFFTKQGCESYYSSYEMRRDCRNSDEGLKDARIRPCEAREELEAYSLIQRSIQDNPDISLPDFDQWQKNRRKASGGALFVLQQEERLVGFASVCKNPEAVSLEIRTIGVDPRERSRGWGKVLLRHCLGLAAEQKLQRSELAVAVQNLKALELYRGQGFEIAESSKVYVSYRHLWSGRLGNLE